MSDTNNVNTINYQDYFELSNGTAQLKEDYKGSENSWKLPEVMVIPDQIDGTEVEFLADSMFKNNTHVKEITLPTTATAIPHDFCCNATNLRSIRNKDGNTETITYIGGAAFAHTRIKEALFPNLKILDLKEVDDNKTGEKKLVGGAFAGCAYLEVADIGKVTTIPERTFLECARLRTVKWNPTKTETEGQAEKLVIGPSAFCQTRSLVDFEFLTTVRPEDVDVQSAAFFYSKIGISWRPDTNKAFPTTDNGTEFWNDASYTPREHRLVTKLSQLNPAWKDKTFLRNLGTKYDSGCALFAVMHIHSAISGKYYNHPDEFVEELKHDPKLSRFLYYRHWPGQFKNVASMFEALGYRTEVHGNGSTLSKQNFQALLDAVANGAYVYAQVGTFSNWTKDWEPEDIPNAAQTKDYYPNAGHAVVIYGIDETGDVCVLDSNILHEAFREDGFEPDIDVYTYSIPFQNIVGPSSNFVIVYPHEEETVAE